MRGSRTAVIVAVLAAFIVATAACTSTSPSPEVRPAADEAGSARGAGDVLVASTSSGDASIDGASGIVLAGGDGSVATPDGSTMFRATLTDAGTTVTSVDPRSGTTIDSVSITGSLELAVASVSGRAIALVPPAPGAPPGSLPGVPVPRARTPIVVAYPTGERDPSRFRLEGNYEPEAFSIDDDRLFMIQYLPAEAPAVYRVVVLDLDSGDVSQVTGRFKSPPERMPGVRLGQVYDPVTSQMYTLYSNQPGAYAHGYEHAGGSSHDWPEQTFIHVLNLRRGWAYCAGLPEAMWGGTAREQSLAPSPDGRSLYVVDARDGLIAVMDTRTLEVVRTARVVLDTDPGARTSLAVGRDGATLFVASSAGQGTVTAIDTETLSLAERWPASIPISGLGISLDGSSLYAAGGGRITVVDSGTGASIATLPTTGLGPIVGLEPLPPV